MADTTFSNLTQGWHPLNTVPNGNIVDGTPQYNYIFEAQGDIGIWELRRSINWFAPMIPGLLFAQWPGHFEYKIFDPSDNLIFWSEVTVVLQIVFQDIGILFFVWTAVDDVTQQYQPTTIPAPGNTSSQMGALTYPNLVQAVDGSQRLIDQMNISYPSLPTNADSLVVQRGEFSTVRNMVTFQDLGTMTLVDSSYTYQDSTTDFSTTVGTNGAIIQEGNEYYYRIKAISSSYGVSIGPALSTILLNPSFTPAQIQTYVIDGHKTLEYNTLSPDEIVPEEEATLQAGIVNSNDYIFFPINREETLDILPASGSDMGIGGGLIDTWWYGPVYNKFIIPNMSRLVITKDGFSSGEFTQQGMSAEWQFKYELASQLWGIIREISGKMLSAETNNNYVTIISGDNPSSLDSISSTRVLFVLDGATSAFIFNDGSGNIYVGARINGANTLYFSSNKGVTFQPLMRDSNTQFTFFNNDPSYKIIDMAKNNNTGVIYILAVNGNALFIQNSSDAFIDIQYVGEFNSGQNYLIETRNAVTGTNELSVVGPTNRYISTNGGKSWISNPIVG